MQTFWIIITQVARATELLTYICPNDLLSKYTTKLVSTLLLLASLCCYKN